jgi:flagellar hook-associated protein FlgK
LDEQYRDQYADYCESEYLTQGLGYLEDLFNELDDKTSLTASLSSFFDALSDFADDPTSEAARTSVQQTAVTLTGNFNMIYNEMIDLYNDQNKSVKTVATQINELASEIAALNKTIGDYERSGQTATELRDRRNALVDKLSGYVDITCTEDATGMVTVQVAGETLVEGKIYNEIQITAQTDEMNSICGAIASFNDQITAAVAGGAPAEDIAALEAQRDALCSRLQVVAEGVGITIEADQTATVTFAGQDLVVGSTAAAVSADAVRAYAGADIKNILRLGETYLTTDTIQGGELRAHMRLRDDNTTEATGIPHYVDQLNKLARTIVKTMNECMNTGYTYPDEENGYSSVTGPDVDLFEDFGGDYDSVTAGNLAVSASVLASVWNLAGSSREIHLDAEDTQNSNNVVALRLAELINTGSFKSDLDSLISKLGLQVQSSKNRLDVRLALVESTQGQRESISGVSVD